MATLKEAPVKTVSHALRWLLVAASLLLASCQTVTTAPEVEQVEDNPPAAQPASISSVEPATVLPGQAVIVLGSNFGMQPGQLLAADGSEVPVSYWSDVRIDFVAVAAALPISIVPAGSAEPAVLLGDDKLEVRQPPVTTRLLVEANVDTLRLNSAATIRFSVQLLDEAGSATAPAEVDWQVTDSQILAVTQTGEEHSYVLADTRFEELTVQGLQVGKTEITVTAVGHSAALTLEVLDYPIGLTIEPAETELVIGRMPAAPISAKLLLASGASEDAAAVTWASSDSRVATVTDGVVTGVAEGQATVTAYAEGYQASTIVNVTDPVVGLELADAPIELRLGAEIQLEAREVMASGARRLPTGTLVWSSDNGDAISVTADGLITASSIGTAKIEVSSDDRTATAIVNALDHVTAITIHRHTNGVQVEQMTVSGMQSQIFPYEVTATLHYASGATAERATGLEWSSTSPNIAIMQPGAVNTIRPQSTTSGMTILYATHPESGVRTHLLVNVLWPQSN